METICEYVSHFEGSHMAMTQSKKGILLLHSGIESHCTLQVSKFSKRAEKEKDEGTYCLILQG
jgi:hypothetical protein